MVGGHPGTGDFFFFFYKGHGLEKIRLSRHSPETLGRGSPGLAFEEKPNKLFPCFLTFQNVPLQYISGFNHTLPVRSPVPAPPLTSGFLRFRCGRLWRPLWLVPPRSR